MYAKRLTTRLRTTSAELAPKLRNTSTLIETLFQLPSCVPSEPCLNLCFVNSNVKLASIFLSAEVAKIKFVCFLPLVPKINYY